MSLLRTFTLRNSENLASLVAFLKANARAFADQGKPLSVTVAEYKTKRSIEQNKRYHAILREISEGAWIGGKQFSTDAWHEEFKCRFIGVEDKPSGGTVGISTTTLSVSEFSDLMDKISAYAASDLGIELIL